MDSVNERRGSDMDEWNMGEIGAWRSRKDDKYTLYHKGLEGRLGGLTWQELCQLATVVEKMIADRK